MGLSADASVKLRPAGTRQRQQAARTPNASRKLDGMAERRLSGAGGDWDATTGRA